MADAAPSRSTSQLPLVLLAGVLMLACGVGAYLVVRDPAPESGFTPVAIATPGEGTEPGSENTGSTVGGGEVTTPENPGYTLDAALFSLVLPGLPEEAQESSTSGAATIPATRWTYATDVERLVVYTADYAQVVATGALDTQLLFDSIVNAGASVAGATMPTNESITIGTDLARRATINTNGTWTYLTLVWHGTNLLAIVAESAADQPPAAYTAAVESLVWKD